MTPNTASYTWNLPVIQHSSNYLWILHSICIAHNLMHVKHFLLPRSTMMQNYHNKFKRPWCKTTIIDLEVKSMPEWINSWYLVIKLTQNDTQALQDPNMHQSTKIKEFEELSNVFDCLTTYIRNLQDIPRKLIAFFLICSCYLSAVHLKVCQDKLWWKSCIQNITEHNWQSLTCWTQWCQFLPSNYWYVR